MRSDQLLLCRHALGPGAAPVTLAARPPTTPFTPGVAAAGAPPVAPPALPAKNAHVLRPGGARSVQLARSLTAELVKIQQVEPAALAA